MGDVEVRAEMVSKYREAARRRCVGVLDKVVVADQVQVQQMHCKFNLGASRLELNKYL